MNRTLGGALEVPAIGTGAMALIDGLYGQSDDDNSIALLRHAIDVGAGFIDTSDAYGPDGQNERLVGRAIESRRDKATVATKWGYAIDGPGTPLALNWDIAPEADARPETARRRLDASLERLGVDVIDLWYLHVVDPSVAIEESVGAMAEAVGAGKVRHLGVSNVTVDELERACATHPIAAVQQEWSLWSRTVERQLLPSARRLGVGVVAWAPLGAGFLTGTVSKLAETDFRNVQPRYQGDNLATNIDRFAPLRALATELSVTPAQLALSWLLHQGDDVTVIPGTRSTGHLDENVATARIVLSDDVLRRIDTAFPEGLAAGPELLPADANRRSP